MKVSAKIHKTYNYLIRAAIIAATYGFLYRQVFYRRNLDEVFATLGDFLSDDLFRRGMALLLLMMLVNWGLEAFKWKVLIDHLEKVSVLRAWMAVFAGVSVSIFLPNRTGEYLGRVFILKKANRMEGVLTTIIGSISQLVITLCLGLFGFLAFYYKYFNKQGMLHDYAGAGLILLVPVAAFVLLIMYFNMPRLTPVLGKVLRGRWAKYAHYGEVFSRYGKADLLRVLLLSLLRYVVFSTQFYLLLALFRVHLPYTDAIILITTIYLFMVALPTVALTEIGIRGSLSVFLVSMYFQRAGMDAGPMELGIFAASSLLWLINIVIPALAGTLFVFNLKFFRK